MGLTIRMSALPGGLAGKTGGQHPTPLTERHEMRRFLLVFKRDTIVAEGIKWSDGRIHLHRWESHGWIAETSMESLLDLFPYGRIVWCDS